MRQRRGVLRDNLVIVKWSTVWLVVDDEVVLDVSLVLYWGVSLYSVWNVAVLSWGVRVFSVRFVVGMSMVSTSKSKRRAAGNESSMASRWGLTRAGSSRRSQKASVPVGSSICFSSRMFRLRELNSAMPLSKSILVIGVRLISPAILRVRQTRQYESGDTFPLSSGTALSICCCIRARRSRALSICSKVIGCNFMK